MSWQLLVEDEYVYSAVCHAVCTVLGFECPVWNELFMPKLYLYVGEGGKIQIIPAFWRGEYLQKIILILVRLYIQK